MGEIVVYLDPDHPVPQSAQVWIDGFEVSHVVNRAAVVADIDAGIITVELRLIGEVRVIHDVTEAPS